MTSIMSTRLPHLEAWGSFALSNRGGVLRFLMTHDFTQDIIAKARKDWVYIQQLIKPRSQKPTLVILQRKSEREIIVCSQNRSKHLYYRPRFGKQIWIGGEANQAEKREKLQAIECDWLKEVLSLEVYEVEHTDQTKLDP